MCVYKWWQYRFKIADTFASLAGLLHGLQLCHLFWIFSHQFVELIIVKFSFDRWTKMLSIRPHNWKQKQKIMKNTGWMKRGKNWWYLLFMYLMTFFYLFTFFIQVLFTDTTVRNNFCVAAFMYVVSDWPKYNVPIGGLMLKCVQCS